jgi:hypothetical protein
MLAVPVGVVLEVLMVSVAVCGFTPSSVTDVGDAVQVEPLGAPTQLSVTVSLNPFKGVTVTFVFVDCPRTTVSDLVERVVEKSGHCRWLRISGGRGACVKLNASVMSFAAASRAVSGGSPKRTSANRKNEEASYNVWEIEAAVFPHTAGICLLLAHFVLIDEVVVRSGSTTLK